MFENYFKNLASLREEEQIELIVRHHWFTFAKAFLKIVTPLIALLVFIYMFGFARFLSLFNSVIFSWIALILFLIWLTFSLYSWFIWYFDAALITNQRVIVVEQKRLFEKSVSETSFDKIQDITTTITGPSQTLLGYGSVVLQTASEMNNLIIREVARPGEIQQKILHLKDARNTADN